MWSAIKATVVRARLMQAEAWAHLRVISQVWAYVGNRLQVWLNPEAPMTPHTPETLPHRSQLCFPLQPFFPGSLCGAGDSSLLQQKGMYFCPGTKGEPLAS